jgi:drug/metabolite transporter (DMT)-like permease
VTHLSRKFIIGVMCLFLGTAFGIYCINKQTDLLAAGAYWGAVIAGAYGYMYSNIQEKVKMAQITGNGQNK